MNHQEQLFLAIGGADPALVARSEEVRQDHWLLYIRIAAACLLLFLTLRAIQPVWAGVPAVPPGSQNDPPVTAPNPPEDPGGQELILPEQGGEIGALHLLSCSPQTPEAVDFLIYVNEEQFSICEDDGLYSIRSINPLPEDFPECGLDIRHLSSAAPQEAREAAQAALKEQGLEVTTEELSAALPGSLYLRAGAGTDWDSEQLELWFAEDGQGGTFVLAARYFLEAEEGLGARFRDMASSFRSVSLNEVVPDWIRTLYEAADRLFPALFSDDLAPVADLLKEDSAAEAYGADVWADVTIASVDYAPDDDQNPTQATVSVKHRLNQVEGDSFSYLTMELVRQDGQWRLAWSGIEK